MYLGTMLRPSSAGLQLADNWEVPLAGGIDGRQLCRDAVARTSIMSVFVVMLAAQFVGMNHVW